MLGYLKKILGHFFNCWVISRINPTVGLNSIFKYLTQLLGYLTQLEFDPMHLVKLTHSWGVAIPPHSLVIHWVIFNPIIISEHNINIIVTTIKKNYNGLYNGQNYYLINKYYSQRTTKFYH